MSTSDEESSDSTATIKQQAKGTKSKQSPKQIQLEKLVDLQRDFVQRIQNALRNFTRDSNKRYSHAYFKARLANVEKLRDGCEENHQLIFKSGLEKSHEYFTENLIEVFEEEYLAVVCAITDKYNEFASPLPDNQSTPHANTASNATTNPLNQSIPLPRPHSPVRLPKLDLQPFSGKYIDWPPFYDAFKRFVHLDASRSKVEKFHRLKLALPDNFDSDIRDLSITEANYDIAWNLLVKRYNDKRVLFTHCMNRFSSQQPVKKENAPEIKQLINTSRTCFNTLRQMGVKIDQCDEILVHFLIAKLPPDTHSLWEQHLGISEDIPSFTKLMDFLEIRHRTLEALHFTANSIAVNYVDPTQLDSLAQSKPNSNKSKSNGFKPKSNSKYETRINHTSTPTAQPIVACSMCKESHIIRRCPKFLALDGFERKSFVDRSKHCVNCLSSTHLLAACPSTRNCNICGKRHHTLLHFPYNNTNQVPAHVSNPNSVQASTHSTSINHITSSQPTQLPPVLANSLKFISKLNVLVPTAIVRVLAPDGSKFLLRTLVDEGSTGALISERATQALNLKRFPFNSAIKYPDGQHSATKFATTFSIQSRFDENQTPIDVFASVVKSVTSDLPVRTIQHHDWPHLRDLDLADPDFYRSAPIDLLIGSDICADIIMLDIIKGKSKSEPIAKRTSFGWIVLGRASDIQSSTAHIEANHTVCAHAEVDDLESLVKQFYTIETVPAEHQYSSEEKWCQDFFDRTTIRQPNGKYLVRLPFKTLFDPHMTIGKSKQMSLNRLHSLERKLASHADLREQYCTAISEYFALDQIAPVFTNESQHTKFNENGQPYLTCCTLAHFPIIKSDSLTTKCRPVFDASVKTSSGRSLNDILCIGPRLQTDLPAVLLNWRMHRYVITSYIEKMYRCIDMNSDDAEYQRIVWRDKDGQIQEYKLTTVTFGTAPAPYMAIAITHKIVDDERERYPLAVNVLKNEIYIDDVYSGGDTIQHVCQIRDHTKDALLSAGMKLHKWASNSPELLKDIPANQQSSATALELNSKETLKTLGMRWQPSNDSFQFKINFQIDPNIASATKRTILSTIAKLFDPMGLINPVIVTCKIFMKRIWSFNLDWDEPIPIDLLNEWKQILISLPDLADIQVPRWLHFSSRSTQNIEIHAFCDGSTQAYGSNIYLRVLNDTNEIYTNIITGKTKVTPKTSLCIPRVELCAAVMGIKLVKWALKHLQTQNIPCKIYYWTDATIVLSWIRGDINRWPVFVANRIGFIHTESNVNQWHHVSTHENPADHSSRGLTPAQLAKSDLYWYGPKWLSEPESNWPVSDWTFLEKESEHAMNAAIRVNTDNLNWFHRYSTFKRLRRMTAWLFRFHNNCRTTKEFRRFGPLTVAELDNAVFYLVRLIQKECFYKELKSLKCHEPVHSKSVLASVTPFLDENQIMRVRGRLQNALLSYDEKHPIILPKHHPFTKLFINHAHHSTEHGGIQLTTAFIRKQFWIIHSRKVIKSHIKSCVDCFKAKPFVSQQLMGDLPVARVTHSVRPFLATGIDYTGFIDLKASRFRGQTTYKGYIAVFICLATKAIHLEAVSGMTTDHFLCALHRFIGRRGMCSDIYSDNGTNFVGGDRVLQTNTIEFREGLEKDILPLLADKGIQWHFIPPHSPNFGGLWESNVKAVKYHLSRILNGTPLTFEELTTVLARIESCLNSRPLCALTTDVDDLTVLTPGHFLIGDSLLAPPEPPVLDMSPHRHYLKIQRLIQQFWARWSSDWLGHLQSRPKWCNQQTNLQVNDMVLVKDDRLPPNQWLLGRIIQTHPEADQLVRVVTIRTKNGTYKRCVSKVCRLPLDPSTHDNTHSP